MPKYMIAGSLLNKADVDKLVVHLVNNAVTIHGQNYRGKKVPYKVSYSKEDNIGHTTTISVSCENEAAPQNIEDLGTLVSNSDIIHFGFSIISENLSSTHRYASNIKNSFFEGHEEDCIGE